MLSEYLKANIKMYSIALFGFTIDQALIVRLLITILRGIISSAFTMIQKRFDRIDYNLEIIQLIQDFIFCMNDKNEYAENRLRTKAYKITYRSIDFFFAGMFSHIIGLNR